MIGRRILTDGPVFRLHAAAAQTIGMAVHELATNAGKYGALSNDVGTVDIAWRIERGGDGSRLFLSWIETGGPPVTAPDRQGFGTTVLGAMAKHGLKANIKTSYESSGFAWHLDCPLDAAGEAALSGT